jgi:excisionase family DNA binding protein
MSVPTTEVSRWLTVESAAAYLHVHAQTIRNAMRRGDIRASRLADAGPYLIDRFELDRLLERRKKVLGPYRKGTHPWVAKRHAENRKA